MTALICTERPAAVEPAGLLVLHHGRGADEMDLVGLADVLDPGRRLHVASPRAPLQLPGTSGYHWYVVPRVGLPDPATFEDALGSLGELHDELWQRTGTGPSNTVLGGFSQGAVMSYAMALDPSRPAPSGALAFSGFVPVVPGWQPVTAERRDLRVFIAHGRGDPVIDVAFARDARDLLISDGLEVSYHESDAAHHIDPTHLRAAIPWVAHVAAGPSPERRL